jgi:hypothetical protein
MIWFPVIMIWFPETRKSNPLKKMKEYWVGATHPAKAGKNRKAETTGMIYAPICWHSTLRQ